MSRTDLQKRQEIFAELVYYLIDSFIIPLISGNFHVTESTVNRNQLMYFRHDVWKKLAEPSLAYLKTSMFEELSLSQVKKTLSRRSLGTSRIRLVPKDVGLRPIINLRRRVQKMVNGKLVLGKSINSVLNPAFNALKWEKVREISLMMTEH